MGLTDVASSGSGDQSVDPNAIQRQTLGTLASSWPQGKQHRLVRVFGCRWEYSSSRSLRENRDAAKQIALSEINVNPHQSVTQASSELMTALDKLCSFNENMVKQIKSSRPNIPHDLLGKQGHSSSINTTLSRSCEFIARLTHALIVMNALVDKIDTHTVPSTLKGIIEKYGSSNDSAVSMGTRLLSALVEGEQVFNQMPSVHSNLRDAIILRSSQLPNGFEVTDHRLLEIC